VGKENRLPWWLEGGEEICSFCGQPYSYEMEHRCVHCDSPLCPWCCLEEDEGRTCPQCASCGEGE
jgi:hypothetical protein